MMKRGKPYRDNKEKWTGICKLKCRHFVVSVLDKLPQLKKLLVCIHKYLVIFRYQRRLKRVKQKRECEFDINKTYWIEPANIVYCSLNEFNIYKYSGEVIRGDWDQLERKFEDLDIYIAFKERFIAGKNWEDTAWYQEILQKITEGKLPGRLRNRLELEVRCKNFDDLYESIKEKGYRIRGKIIAEDNCDDPMGIEDEIAINVGRNGDLLFNNGAHRLVIVKLLNIRKIQVKITVRHPQWLGLRRQIQLYAREHRGKIYHPITHPDLQDIHSFHGSDRFDIIEKHLSALSARKGLLLDIGAHWGYFCHKFEEIGFDCYAVENDKLNVYFLKKLKIAENRCFKIISESIFKWRDVKNIHFDLVLALNIFHHFLKEEESYNKLISLLKNLQMREMFFEPHLDTELKGANIYKRYSEVEFVEFILQNSILNNAKLIGKDADGRSLYKLY